MVIIVVLVQVAVLLVWWLGTGVTSLGFVAVGAMVTVAADTLATLGPIDSTHDRLLPAPTALIVVAAGGFALTVLMQLMRTIGQRNVTRALSEHVLVILTMLGLATLILVARTPEGYELVRMTAVTASCTLAVTHGFDIVLPRPAIHRDVMRGIPGLSAGFIAGVISGAFLFPRLVSEASSVMPAMMAPATAGALLGAATALLVLVLSLAVSYGTTTSRRSAEEESDEGERTLQPVKGRRLATTLLAPLVALAGLAPIGYIAAPLLQHW